MCLVLIVVQFHRRLRDLRKRVKPLLACFLTALVFAASALSAFPSLHQSVHRATATADGNCVICLFAHGQANAADVAVLPAGSSTTSFALVLVPRVTALPSVEYRLLPSRAPPSDRLVRSA